MQSLAILKSKKDLLFEQMIPFPYYVIIIRERFVTF